MCAAHICFLCAAHMELLRAFTKSLDVYIFTPLSSDSFYFIYFFVTVRKQMIKIIKSYKSAANKGYDC